MVVVSATMYFPEQARAIMRQVPVENQSAVEWETIRKRHKLGDEQIVASSCLGYKARAIPAF
jgi:hypothetical protein